MLSRLRPTRPSPALVISLIALFVSLGGVSYGVATGSIDGREIKNSTIQSKDVKNNSLTGGDVRNRSLLAKDFRSGQLPRGQQGPAGARGPAGPAGSALGFVTMDDDGVVVPARSFRVTQANVTKEGTAFCFRGLPFTPRAAVGAVDAGAATQTTVHTRVGTDYGGCAGSEQAAAVKFGGSTSPLVVVFY